MENDPFVVVEARRQELASLRAKGALERERQALEKAELQQRFQQAEKRLATALQNTDLCSSSSSLHVYTQCIQTARSNDTCVTPHYATHLESQVCRSVHHVVLLKKQLAMTKWSCDALIQLLQGTVTFFADDTNRMEINGMNGMYAATGSKASMELHYAMELQAQTVFKKKLMEQQQQNKNKHVPSLTSPRSTGIMDQNDLHHKLLTAGTMYPPVRHHHHGKSGPWNHKNKPSRATSSLRTNSLHRRTRSTSRN